MPILEKYLEDQSAEIDLLEKALAEKIEENESDEQKRKKKEIIF